MIPLSYYIETLKVTGVVRLSTETSLVNETKKRVMELIVCMSGDTYKQINTIRVDSDNPYIPNDRNETSLIKKEEYECLKAQYGVIDSELYWQKVSRLREIKRTIEMLLKDMIPKCPSCGSGTEIKNRHKDGRPFWSCRRYPSCYGLVDIDHVQKPDMKRFIDELKELSIEIETFETGPMPEINVVKLWTVSFLFSTMTTIQTTITTDEAIPSQERLIQLAREKLIQEIGADVVTLVGDLGAYESGNWIQVEECND